MQHSAFIWVIGSFCLYVSCTPKEVDSAAKWKAEIEQAEKQFEEAAGTKGIAESFYLFADDSAVIKRANDTLIKGKENIKLYYESSANKNAQVNWAPDFVSVSADGTLGYTYGKYVWKIPGDSGTFKEFRGVFHTVWKRQSDGSWKYVWD